MKELFVSQKVIWSRDFELAYCKKMRNTSKMKRKASI